MIFNRFINIRIANITCRLIIDDPDLFAYFNKTYVRDDVIRKTLIKIYLKKSKKHYQLIFKPFNLNFYLTINNKYLFKDVEWVIRKVLQFILVKYKIIFLHGSAFVIKNQVNIFLGKSGAGKTTIVKNAPKKNIYGDDIIVIKKEKDSLFAYQSPFEKDRISNIKIGKMSIAGIFYLKKGKSLITKTINHQDKFDLLVTDGYMPRFPKNKNNSEYKKNMKKFNDLTLFLIRNISIKKLYFPKNFKFDNFQPKNG